jgi:hypothetical protein
MTSRIALAAALLFSTAALAQTGNHPMTGGGDAPKTTTSATETKTTDAAGLGAPVPGTTDAAHAPIKPKPAPRRHHRTQQIVPSAPH